MRELILTKNMRAIVDDEDYNHISKNKWTFTQQGYAVRTYKQKREYLHRVILGAKRGQFVDHKDGDKLNNTRKNLRFVSTSQNNINRHKARPTSKSGIPGVWLKEFYQKGYVRKYYGWIAEIRFNRRKKVRMFRTKEEAIECRKKMEVELLC